MNRIKLHYKEKKTFSIKNSLYSLVISFCTFSVKYSNCLLLFQYCVCIYPTNHPAIGWMWQGQFLSVVQ